MTGPRKHLARELFEMGPNGRTVLRCRCGAWTADRTQTIRNQRLAHRAHRVEMGETVKPLKPTPAERLKAAEAAIARVRKLHRRDREGKCGLCRYFDTTNWGGLRTHWPCDTIRALDGDAPKETTT